VLPPTEPIPVANSLSPLPTTPAKQEAPVVALSTPLWRETEFENALGPRFVRIKTGHRYRHHTRDTDRLSQEKSAWAPDLSACSEHKFLAPRPGLEPGTHRSPG
jgi:hypothetical protein